MKRHLMMIALALWATMAGAQTKVVGVYADSISNKPVPFATVALVPDSAQMPEQVMLTGTDGKFELTTRQNGLYRLSIAQMGQRTLVVDVDAQGTTVDVGRLLAVEESAKLEAVNVVAVKPLVRSEIDRVAYEVENDPDAPVKTVFDMLRKTPLVTIDAEDNIMVNGHKNPTILVNERRSGMFNTEPIKVLKSMPAEAIKSIEVITSPGAKYEAQGEGCIINLVMSKKTTMIGAMGTLRGEYGTKTSSVGGHVIAKAGKLTMSANMGLNRDNTYHDAEVGMQNLSKGDVVSEISVNNLHSDERNSGGHLYTETSYEIDSIRLLTLNVNLWGGEWSSENKDANMYYSQAPDFESRMLKSSDSHSDWKGYGIDLGYERKWAKKNTLVLLANLSQSPNTGGRSKQTTRPLEGYTVPDMMSDEHSRNTSNSLEYNLQTDYTRDCAPGRRIEAGAKYTWRNNGTDRSSVNLNCNTLLPIYSDTSSVTQKQSIWATYASYTINFGKFGLKAGLRSETAHFDVANTAGLKQGSFQYTNTDLVPSLYVGYNFSPAQSLKLNYSMRIQRPSIGYVDPMVSIDMMGNQNHGNPDLESERHHNVSVDFTRYSQKLMLMSSLGYNFCNSSIQSYNYTDEQTGINHSTYGNIGRISNANASIFARAVITTKTVLTVSLSGQYTDIEARVMNEHAKGFSGGGYVVLEQELPWRIHTDLTAYVGSRQIGLQSNTKSYSIYLASVSRQFWEDRINVRFHCSNPFQKTFDYDQESWTEFQRTSVKARVPYRTFNLSASIRLGKLRAQVRKVSSSITSDDLKNVEKKRNEP